MLNNNPSLLFAGIFTQFLQQVPSCVPHDEELQKLQASILPKLVEVPQTFSDIFSKSSDENISSSTTPEPEIPQQTTQSFLGDELSDNDTTPDLNENDTTPDITPIEINENIPKKKKFQNSKKSKNLQKLQKIEKNKIMKKFQYLLLTKGKKLNLRIVLLEELCNCKSKYNNNLILMNLEEYKEHIFKHQRYVFVNQLLFNYMIRIENKFINLSNIVRESGIYTFSYFHFFQKKKFKKKSAKILRKKFPLSMCIGILDEIKSLVGTIEEHIANEVYNTQVIKIFARVFCYQ
jgi:hypothetical protein